MFVGNLTIKGFNQSLISTQVGVKRGKICLIAIELEALLLLVLTAVLYGAILKDAWYESQPWYGRCNA
jgi:hypothetical protein